MPGAYQLYQDAGFQGMLYDTNFDDIMSYAAGTAIPFGVPVVLGTDPSKQVNAVGTGAGQGALAYGIAAASHTVEQSYPVTGTSQYAVTDSVPVLKRGRIWVLTNDAVVAGATANLVLANGTFTDEVVAAGIEAFTQFTARFVTGTTAAGLAVLEITRK